MLGIDWRKTAIALAAGFGGALVGVYAGVPAGSLLGSTFAVTIAAAISTIASRARPRPPSTFFIPNPIFFFNYLLRDMRDFDCMWQPFAPDCAASCRSSRRETPRSIDYAKICKRPLRGRMATLFQGGTEKGDRT